MDNLKLDYHPTVDVIDSFFPTLKKEYDETGRGMYCNWNIIKERLSKDQLIAFLFNNVPVGFLTWYRDDKIVELEIIWIAPNYRKLGLGLKFQDLLEKEFKRRGDVALTLFCASKDGLSLAQRAGFSPQSNHARFDNPNLELGLKASCVKILRNSQPLLFDNQVLSIKCYENFHNEDSLFCELPLSADFEKKPTYFFIDGNWECKVVYQGQVIRESKMKYILQDLKVKEFGYIVAFFNRNIVIPQHWIQ